jgi:hypothetical protein
LGFTEVSQNLGEITKPSGALVSTGKGSDWITVLTEPFNAYFRSKENERLLDFSLRAYQQEQTTKLSIENIRSKYILGIGTALIIAAIIFGVFRGKV